LKRIYLVRHAKSSWSNPELRDFDRPLNKRGKYDAPFMAGLLKEKGIHPEIIVSSPAKRAFATAIFFAEVLGYPAENIIQDSNLYEAGVKDILKVISLINENIWNIMIFGHNPGLTDAANFITGSHIDNIATSGVVSCISDREHWNKISEKSCILEFFEYPKKYYEEK
jgi:phosphohistidine phosphatase